MKVLPSEDVRGLFPPSSFAAERRRRSPRRMKTAPRIRGKSPGETRRELLNTRILRAAMENAAPKSARQTAVMKSAPDPL